MSEKLGHKAVTGAIWASADRFGTMALQFVVNLVLARLLMPSDYGAIGMLAIFIAVSSVLIDGGFGSALIQKKSPSSKDYSTLFWWNLSFSSLLYFVLFLAAPFISDFYSMPQLSHIMRVIGISLIINSIYSIQIVRLKKSFDFKSIAIVNLTSYVIASIFAVWFAYCGWGVWSLVAMQIIQGLVSLFILAVVTKWIPSREFSKKSLKELFAFGGFIMSADILQEICKNVQGVIIGKKFSATQLGYYAQAYKLDRVISYSIPQVIVQVMYPVYSSIQDEKEKLKEVTCMNLRVISFIIYPVIAILILNAQPLILLLYGNKWIECIPYFQIMCVGGFFVCLQNINYYVVAAVGKSKALFNWSFYKWGFLLFAILIGMQFGMSGILWGMVSSSFNIFLVNSFLAAKYAEISIGDQFKSILPIMITNLATFIITFLMSSLIGFWVFSIIIYLGLYCCISCGLKLKATSDSTMLIKRIINKQY